MGAFDDAARYIVNTEIVPAFRKIMEEIINNKIDNGKSIADELINHPEIKDLEDYLKKLF